jgi:hypothetical protein
MSRCLTDEQLQALADGEAVPGKGAHIAECQRCAERLAARKRLIARAIDAAGTTELPTDVRDAMRTRLDRSTAAGATTLRPVRRAWRWAWWIPLTAAAVIALVVFVIPGVDRRTTVSAAEILGRSRSVLAAPVSGIEVLTYDLELNGVLAEVFPEEQSGRFTVQELVDHDHEGRYRIVKLTSDGQIVGGAADDPIRGTRTRYMRANGRGYLLRFDGAEPSALSVPALKRSALQAFVGFMQASNAQTMHEVQRGADACYQIDMPGGGLAGGTLVAIDSARALVTVADSRLVEFSASGRVAERPFKIEFSLLTQDVHSSQDAPDSDFDIAPQPGDVILQGNASQSPVWDVVSRALRAIPQDAGIDSKPPSGGERSRH